MNPAVSTFATNYIRVIERVTAFATRSELTFIPGDNAGLKGHRGFLDDLRGARGASAIRRLLSPGYPRNTLAFGIETTRFVRPLLSPRAVRTRRQRCLGQGRDGRASPNVVVSNRK
jgi:hypothetical protein